jgi:hypothetical protein
MRKAGAAALAFALGVVSLGITPAPARAGDTYNAVYQAYVAGLNAVELRSSFTFDPGGYKISVSSRTRGMTGMVWSGQQVNEAAGNWQPQGIRPRDFRIDGLWRGNVRRAHIAFLGDGPVIRDLEPPERGRVPVPEAERRDAMDPLSVLAALSRLVTEQNTCDGSARVFDGRKLELSSARTVGWEVLPASSSTVFSGRALRCDVEVKLIGGFLKGADSASQEKPKRGSVWIAPPAPGAPQLPVMFKLNVNWLGEATVFLTEFARKGSQAVN